MKSDFKKVLICSPTASAKNYCFDEWIENVFNFSYPNFEVRLFDNTNDNGRNAKYLNERVRKQYGDVVGIDKLFYAQNSLLLNASKEKDVIPKMTISHQDCVRYAARNKIEYMLHLETDVMPYSKGIIENLMFAKKRIIGAVYYRDFGINRSVMLQHFVELPFYNAISMNYGPEEDLHFLDGNVKPTAHCGLGCILIHTSVFDKVKFRYEEDSNTHPDSYFASDCKENGYHIFVDTFELCRHENQEWGIYRLDYK